MSLLSRAPVFCGNLGSLANVLQWITARCELIWSQKFTGSSTTDKHEHLSIWADFISETLGPLSDTGKQLNWTRYQIDLISKTSGSSVMKNKQHNSIWTDLFFRLLQDFEPHIGNQIRHVLPGCGRFLTYYLKLQTFVDSELKLLSQDLSMSTCSWKTQKDLTNNRYTKRSDYLLQVVFGSTRLTEL